MSSDSPETMASGVERCRVDFGFEQGRVKRFTWWGLPHRLGSASDLEPCWSLLLIAALPAISWTFLLQAEAPRPANKALDHGAAFMPTPNPVRLFLRTCLNQVS
jgi:hypothetical protein